jgi:hypothetical protein
MGIAILAAVAFSAAVVPAGTAAAATLTPSAPHTVKVDVPMHVVGFDAAVARAHGYVIRTDSRGRQYSVKEGTKAGAVPATIVYGNCGYSWMFYDALGNRTVQVSTGFDVYAPAVLFWWQYTMVDNGGTSTHTHPGVTFSYSWSTPPDVWGGMTPGYSFAFVNASSYAILSNGSICSSLGPWDSTDIY